MNRHQFVAAFFVIALLTAPAFAKDKPLAKVDLLNEAKGIRAYEIEGGEVVTGTMLIKRVELGEHSAIVTYFNKFDTRQSPDFVFRLINAYGIEIGRFQDKWLIQSINPGEAHKEEKNFFRADVDKILQFSNVTLPRDWKTPVYLVVEGKDP